MVMPLYETRVEAYQAGRKDGQEERDRLKALNERMRLALGGLLTTIEQVATEDMAEVIDEAHETLEQVLKGGAS